MVCRLYHDFYSVLYVVLCLRPCSGSINRAVLEDIKSHSVTVDDSAVTSIHSEQEVPAFNQADLNQENHK